MYHPSIAKLDAAAIELHPVFPEQSKSLFVLTGELQHEIARRSPFQTRRRFFDAQWCWALGHIGILYQAIRWFHKNEPQTKLILETQGKIANRYFLASLLPYLDIHEHLPEELKQEAQYNAVYFGCPDGKTHVHDFMKVVERECQGVNLLELDPIAADGAEKLLAKLGVKRPFVAIQARYMDYDSKRNVSLEQCEKSLKYYRDHGYSVVSTGLDNHPINQLVPSVLSLSDPYLASFLLSASCDQFIGSDSGAWTIPWAFRRPVELLNDDLFAAWIYP